MGSPNQPTTNIPAFLSALSALNVPSRSSPTGTETYSGIEYAMRQNGVPISPWEATLAAEDPSLDPASHYTGTLAAPEDSYGLWQYNRDGGLGAGIAVSTLTDPYAETQLAARTMGDAVQQYQDSTGDPSDYGALTAIAGAGWPGTATLAYQQGRFANLAAIEAATGQQGSPAPQPQGTAPATPTAPNQQPYSIGSAIAGTALNAAGFPSAQQLAGIAASIGNSLRANTVEWLHSVAFFTIGALVVLGGVAFVVADHPEVTDAIGKAASKAPEILAA